MDWQIGETPEQRALYNAARQQVSFTAALLFSKAIQE